MSNLKQIIPIKGAKRFFPAKGGYVIGPMAVLTMLTMSLLMYFEVVSRTSPVAAFVSVAIQIAAICCIAYAMHWKPRSVSNAS
jgi:hypothetical protein